MTECELTNQRSPDSMQLANDFTVNANFTKVTAEDLSIEMKQAVWPVTILIGIEAALGIIGNLLIIIIYTLHYRRCNFKYFVLCMALIDITSCMTTLPGEMFSQIHWYSYKHEWICKIKSYFNVFTVWSSAFALLLLAYDRYRKICRPLEWQIQPSWAFRACIISVSISGIISMPVIILWGKQSYIYETKGQNITVTICEKAGFYADGIYPFLFIIAAYMVPVVFMICVTYIFNFLIARTIFTKIPTAKNSNNIPLHQLEEGGGVHDNSTFRRLRRRHSDIETSCTCKFIHRRLSANMDVCQTNRHSDKDCQALETLSELNGHTGIQDYSLVDHQLSKSFMNGFSTVKSETHDIQCDLRRPRSCSSSGSSGSIVLKHQKRKFLSPSSLWHSPITRRRISESERSVNSMAEDGHTSVRREVRALRLKRKTEIMLILTTVFTVTIIIYLVLVSKVANRESILKELSKSEKVVFFLFWRFYFINCVINPILYGLMDPRFRKGLKEIVRVKKIVRNRSSKSSPTQVTVV